MPSFTTVNEYAVPATAVFDTIADTTTWHTFTGFGPLPGIACAEPSDTPLRVGSVVRVTNTDGSVHHERVTAFERGGRYTVELTFGAPAAWVVRRMVEDIAYEPTAAGVRVRRAFHVEPRSLFAWPLAALLAHLLLKVAVRRHDAHVKGRLERAPRH